MNHVVDRRYLKQNIHIKIGECYSKNHACLFRKKLKIDQFLIFFIKNYLFNDDRFVFKKYSS